MEDTQILRKDYNNFLSISKIRKGRVEFQETDNGLINIIISFKRLRCRKRLVALITNFIGHQILIEYFTDASSIIIKCNRDIIPAVHQHIINPLINLHSSIVQSKEACEICMCFLLKTEEFFSAMSGCYHWIVLKRSDENLVHRFNWVSRHFILLLFLKILETSTIYFTKYGNLVSEQVSFGITQVVEIEKGGELFKVLWGLIKREEPLNNRQILFTNERECIICIEQKTIFTLLKCGHSYCEECHIRSKTRKCFICKDIIK